MEFGVMTLHIVQVFCDLVRMSPYSLDLCIHKHAVLSRVHIPVRGEVVSDIVRDSLRVCC